MSLWFLHRAWSREQGAFQKCSPTRSERFAFFSLLFFGRSVSSFFLELRQKLAKEPLQ
jgi:hypothetical protein